MFAIKADLNRRSYLVIAVFLATSILLLGVAFKSFEMTCENQPLDFRYLSNTMWVIIITMATVGYGDGYPSTHLGRVVAALGFIVGILFISLFIVSLNQTSDFTKEEQKAFYVLKHIRAHSNAKNKASNVIKTVIRLKMAKEKRKKADKAINQFIWFTKLRAAISEFKSQIFFAKSHDVPVDETLRQIQQKLEEDLLEIRECMKDLPTVSTRCYTLKERQNGIINRFDLILKSQNKAIEILYDLHTLSEDGTCADENFNSKSDSQSSQSQSYLSSDITEEDEENEEDRSNDD